MRKETDLAKIKAVAHTFLVMDIQPTAHAPVVVSHPFTNSGFVGVRDVEGNLAIADLLNKPEDCCLWREQIGQYIDQADSAYQVFLLLNKPYMMRSGRPRITNFGPSPRLQHQDLLSWNFEITLRIP